MPRQKKDYEDHDDHYDHDDHVGYDDHDEHDDWRDGSCKNITIEIMTVHILHKSLSLTTPTSVLLSRSPKTSLSTWVAKTWFEEKRGIGCNNDESILAMSSSKESSIL